MSEPQMPGKSAEPTQPPEASEDKMPNITIESNQEWPIFDILLNGQERYVQPLSFSDHVARLSRMIDWPSIAGSKYTIDAANSQTDEEGEEQALASSSSQANVWENVSKEMAASLNEMNAILDVLNITLEGKYMVFDSVARDSSEDSTKQNRSSEVYALVSRRKALSMASSMIMEFVERQRQVSFPGHSTYQNLESAFLRELTELRKGWRVKKAGSVIYGDLTYRTYGPKFRAQSTFEIRQKDVSTLIGNCTVAEASGGSLIEIFLPSDLKENRLLKTFIIADVDDSEDILQRLIGSVDMSLYQRNNQKLIDWQETLENAQKSLICRELFSVLSKEALNMQNRGCMVRGDSLFVQVGASNILVIALIKASECGQLEPAASSGTLPIRDLFFLEQNLLQTYISDVDAITKYNVARPISAPTFNIATRLRMAGPNCADAEQIQTESLTDKLMLEQIALQTEHYVLLELVCSALDAFAKEQRDPIVSVYCCPETSKTTSMIRLHILTPFYEHCSKCCIMIELFTKTIRVTVKDCEAVDFADNINEVMVYIRHKCHQHVISTIASIARPLSWQIISCSFNSISEDNTPAPMILLLSPFAPTRTVRVTYPYHNDQPIVEVQYNEKTHVSSSMETDVPYDRIERNFRFVDIKQLPGFSFLTKFETLLVILDA